MLKIEGQKIRLRDFETEDLETLKRWLIGDQEWKKFDGPYYRKSDLDDHQVITDTMSAIYPTGARSRMFIADPVTNQVIGSVNTYWISKETNWLAAGIVIYDPNYWSGGLGKEALSLWISYQFQWRPEIVRLDLQTWSGNHRMMGLASRLGFQLEGRFRSARIVLGQPFDAIHYGILRSEWLPGALVHPKSTLAPSTPFLRATDP